MQSQIAKLILGILVHIQGATTQHLLQAIQTVEKVSGLAPGQECPVQVANVSEFGNTYELWVIIKRIQK